MCRPSPLFTPLPYRDGTARSQTCRPISLPLVATSGLELSVIIPTLGSYETLDRVLKGLAIQDADPETFEVIVVADAADREPSSVDRAVSGAALKNARRLTGTTPGASANRNCGMDAARGPIVLLIDNDTVPSRRLVSEHLKAHRKHPEPETGVLGLVRWSKELKVTTFMRWLDSGIQFDFASIKGTEAGWGRFATANVSVKREFAKRVGHFDQEHFPYGYEDTDWAYRASQLGFRLLYNGRAVVDHLRTMDLAFWQKRARRVAYSERTFHSLHPELTPWFHTMFEAASQAPPAKGRGIRLAPYVPRWVPWLGERVWRSVDLAYRQALAPHFLSAWDEWSLPGGSAGGPDLSEFSADA